MLQGINTSSVTIRLPLRYEFYRQLAVRCGHLHMHPFGPAIPGIGCGEP